MALQIGFVPTPTSPFACSSKKSKLFTSFWCYKSHHQVNSFLFTKVERKWCTNKCITEGEVWGQDYKMQTLVHQNSKTMES